MMSNRSWTACVRFGLAAVAAATLTLAAGTSQAGEVRHGSEGHAVNPVWSADGKHLAYEINPLSGGNIDLYISELNGDVAKDGRKVELPGGGGGFGGGERVVMNTTWHPTEKLAIFEGSNPSGQFRLYFVVPGGASAAELFPTTKVGGNLQFPAMSPDGNRLVFISSETGSGDVRTWDRSADQFGQLTDTPGTEVYPQYAPDGTTVTFTRKKNDTEDIFLNANGSESSVIGGPGDQSRPVFADGGNKIVYFSSARGEGQWDLAVVNADGTGKKTLATDIRLPERARPAVSPDGEWVAFGLQDPAASTKILAVKVDGSTTIEIDTPHTACGEPALTEQDGRKLLAYTGLKDKDADWRRLYVMDVTGKF